MATDDNPDTPHLTAEFDQDRATVAMAELLVAFGQPIDAHTERTATRAAKAWGHMLAGYGEDPRQHLAVTFPVEGDPGLIIVSGIHVQSTCAHHLLPITGVATVAYRPDRGGAVVGLSKLTRLVEGYARRLTVQEQMGQQVVAALAEVLNPDGAACVITAEHGCMTIRGVEQRGTVTTTVAATDSWLSTVYGQQHPDLTTVLAEHRSRG